MARFFMIRFNYKPAGTSPLSLSSPSAASGPPALTLIQYNGEKIFEAEFETIEALLERYDPSMVNWIDIDGLGDVGCLKKLAAHFNIHPLALEDVLDTTQRPKLERYADHFFIVGEMVYYNNEDVLCFEQVSLFLGAAFVISIQEESGHDVFERIRERLRSGAGQSRFMGADYLAYALLDATVDQMFPVLENVGDSIEAVEEGLLVKPGPKSLTSLYEAKRLLLLLRRTIWPHREIFNSLIRDESGLIHRETQIFLRDCYDHVTQIIDIIESYRDLTAGLMDLYISSLSFRTNEIMRVLTIVSVIFIPLTFLAGVYGMNFNADLPLNMPELNWHFGYLFFWVLCGVLAVAMLIFFKKKNWL